MDVLDKNKYIYHIAGVTGAVVLLDLILSEVWPEGSGIFRMTVLYGGTCFIIWLLLKIYFGISGLMKEGGQIAELLFDLRDGHRTVFKEKRKAPRLLKEMVAKVRSELGEGEGRIREISSEGALLESGFDLVKGVKIDVKIYLTLFPEPVNVKARVVNTHSMVYGEGESRFLTSMKFLEMGEEDQSKIDQTIRILLNKTGT